MMCGVYHFAFWLHFMQIAFTSPTPTPKKEQPKNE